MIEVLPDPVGPTIATTSRGFTWKLILSPLWGVAPSLLGAVGLRGWFHPWLGQEATALTTLARERDSDAGGAPRSSATGRASG